MRRVTRKRSLHWWIWPDFHIEKDALDISRLGVLCCAWIVASAAIQCILQYFGKGDAGLLINSLINILIYSLLGYGILKRSRIAATIALTYFIAGIIWPFIEKGKIGLAPVLIWYFIQSNRAIYWYRGGVVKAEVKLPNFLICPYCNTQSSTKSFRQGTTEWLCPICNKSFPRTY